MGWESGAREAARRSAVAIAGPAASCNEDIKISLCPQTAQTGRRAELHLADGTAAFVTIHPSWLLRIEDEADKECEYANFVADLQPAALVSRKEVA